MIKYRPAVDPVVQTERRGGSWLQGENMKREMNVSNGEVKRLITNLKPISTL